MVLIAPLVGAALFLSGLAAAAPTNSYDSSSSDSKSNDNSNYGSSNSNSNYGSSNDNSNYGSSNSNSNYGSSNSNSNYGSSNSNSNYGSSNSNSNYGNSNSNYGNSNSNYGNSNNNYDSSSSSSYESSSTYDNNNNKYDTSSSSYETSSTTTAYNSYQTSNYGSGSNYWGGSGYEDCVNQCIAQFGGETGGGSYQATATSGSYGSKGNGATHTVIVAPHKGVFRMVPFATNASVGDTIEFHWGADQHTVTKSSQLLPCNKSAEAPVFASGEQNTSFVFTQVVNDTKPTFYYCGTATHCEKGMFGIINPAMATPGSPSSVGGMMQSMMANDSDLSAYAAYTSNLTSNNAVASNWGSAFDMSSIPDWAHGLFLTNVMYTQGVIAKNSDIVAKDNSIDLSPVAANPLMLPLDSNQLNAAAAPASAPGTPAATGGDAGAAPAGAAETAPPSASPSGTKPNGASSVASPRLLVAAAVVVATIFAL